MRKTAWTGAALAATLATGAAAGAEGPYGGVDGGGNYSRDATYAGDSSYDDGTIGAVGLGYRFASGFRPELELAYRENGQSTPSSPESEAQTVMANLWYDLRLPFLAPSVSPHVGLGAGTADVSFAGIPGAPGIVDERVAAYQAGVGVGWDATPQLAFSLGYRYLESESMQVAPGLATRYRSDAVLAGLRFAFGQRGWRRAAAAEAAPAQAEIAALETIVLRPVNFQFDQSDLTGPAQAILDELASRLTQYPELRVVIEGHTDAIGSHQYNLGLGQRRADAVRQYLAQRGIDAARLEAVSRGESEPIADNDSPEGRATNRRAEFGAPQAPSQVKIVIEAPSEASVDAADDANDPGR
jgi:outer membrane protein OmpA-like peptidoglycan-associated protein